MNDMERSRKQLYDRTNGKPLWFVKAYCRWWLFRRHVVRKVKQRAWMIQQFFRWKIRWAIHNRLENARHNRMMRRIRKFKS